MWLREFTDIVHRLREREKGRQSEVAATVPAKKQASLVYIHLICVGGNAFFCGLSTLYLELPT